MVAVENQYPCTHPRWIKWKKLEIMIITSKFSHVIMKISVWILIDIYDVWRQDEKTIFGGEAPNAGQ